MSIKTTENNNIAVAVNVRDQFPASCSVAHEFFKLWLFRVLNMMWAAAIRGHGQACVVRLLGSE